MFPLTLDLVGIAVPRLILFREFNIKMTEYFNNFDKTTFDKKVITNILKRVDFFSQIKENASIYDFLEIKEGETPEILSKLIYGDSNLFWIILWANDIINPYEDWPMTDEQLMTYIENKYGEENVYSVHHYETNSSSDLGEGIWVDQGTSFSSSVSNYTYEYNLNEEKRKIRNIKPNYISQILDEYKRVLS